MSNFKNSEEFFLYTYIYSIDVLSAVSCACEVHFPRTHLISSQKANL